MTSTPNLDYPSRCEHTATRLLWQAVLPIIIVAIFLPAVSAQTPLAMMLTPLAILAGYTTVGLSILLIFDALLFRLMASHSDETSAGAAVDDLLARMRLKPAPPTTRPLEDRIRGSNRILLFQRMTFTVFACSWLAAASQIG